MSQLTLKKSSVVGKVPAVSDLVYGELALNYADGKLYYRTAGDTVVNIIPSLSMTYPGTGIAVSSGSAWSTSLAAPSGTIVGTTDIQTLTNKRIQPRVQPITVASGSTTQAWSSNSYDQINLTLSNTATVTLQLDTGIPTDGQKIMFRIKDDGTSRTIAFTSTGTNCFRNVGTSITLAGTATAASKLIYVGCIYNLAATTWDIIAYGQEA